MRSPLAKRASLRVLFLIALGAGAACTRDAAGDRAAADSVLARDLALAGQQTAAQPTFQDTTVAPTPAPSKDRQRVVEQAPAPRRRAPARIPTRQTPQPQPQPVAQTPAPQPQPITMHPAVAPAPVAGPASSP